MKAKINILYIFHVSEIGGGSFCLLNIIKNLNREFFNPIVLLKGKGPLLDEFERMGVTVYLEHSISTVPYNTSLFKLISIKQLYDIFISLPKIKKWINYTGADVVHINTMMMYPYLYPAFNLKKKTIIHMREHWPSGEHVMQFNTAKKYIKKYADKVIAINQMSAENIDIPEKTAIIYDWINFEERDKIYDFKKLFGENYTSLKILIFLGGTIGIKGAFEVVKTFSEDFPDDNIRLLVVGSASKEIEFIGIKGYVRKLLSIFKINTYTDKVKLLAQKDSRILFLPSTYQIKSLLKQSYCVVSFHKIPHANLVLAEAIYLGIPAIAAETKESLEYSNNGESALLFKLNNLSDFKEKIDYALKNKIIIKKKAEAGSERIKYIFDSIRNSELLNNLYRNL